MDETNLLVEVCGKNGAYYKVCILFKYRKIDKSDCAMLTNDNR